MGRHPALGPLARMRPIDRSAVDMALQPSFDDEEGDRSRNSRAAVAETVSDPGQVSCDS
jgi:hypothetical protein